jgi:hypothetical protein
MKMPTIRRCHAGDCAYNHATACRALAITIADSPGSCRCETFVRFARKGGDPAATGHVGACKVFTCRHNKRLLCSAASIEVACADGNPDCAMFGKAM